MNLHKARVLIAAQYAAPYKGNFIASLKALEDFLKIQYQADCAFVFPKKMNQHPWADKFIKGHRVYLTGDDTLLVTKTHATEIISSFQPTLIYTHFEGYDKVLYHAARENSDSIRIVWHMHDTLGYVKHPIKALYQHLMYFRLYGAPFMQDFLKKFIFRPYIIEFANMSLILSENSEWELQPQKWLFPTE